MMSRQSKVLQVWKSKRVGSSHLAHFPWPTVCTSIAFVRSCVPELQALEHALHSPQSAKTQSALQANVLHSLVSACSGHGSPPFSGSIVLSRRRVITPPLQEAVQSDQALQSSTLQSTGQPIELQSRSIFKGGHCVPLTGWMMIV